MKPALSVSLLGAAAFAVGALAFRLGQSRCAPARAMAGVSSSGREPTGPSLPDPSETVTSFLERLRTQGF